MPHFFIKSSAVVADMVEIVDESNYVHIVKALRSKLGERILLIDENQVQYEVVIEDIGKKSLKARVETQYLSSKRLDFGLYLAQSPLKSDAQNFVIEKATELGVVGVYPIFTDNCALKKSFVEGKIAKYQKIMVEASKQCERADIPTCFELSSLENVVDSQKFDKVIAFTERTSDYSLRGYLGANPIKKSDKVLAIIGSEGGFSNREFEFFRANNIVMVSLGELILKADTAVVVGLGNLVYEYNNK